MNLSYPSISIIMPIRNEKNFIKKSLNAVLSQDYPSDKIEIIIVDGASNDGTKEIINEIKKKNLHRNITILDNPSKIVPVALNIGLKYAKGDIIIRVDGHCEIASDYVRKCVEILAKTGADCVGGIINTKGETKISEAIALAQSSIFGVGRSFFRVGIKRPYYVDTVAFGAYRREVFTRIGNFDEELIRNQDDEFNFRLRQAKGKIWLDPSIRSIYYSRSNLKDLWKQYFGYGLWKVRVFQKRNAISSWRQIIPSFFILSILISGILSIFTHNVLYFFIVFIPYAILNIFFSLLSSRKNIFTLFLLPFCFLTIHLSYGLGFLFGLWKFRRYGFRFLLSKY